MARWGVEMLVLLRELRASLVLCGCLMSIAILEMFGSIGTAWASHCLLVVVHRLVDSP